MKKIMDNDTVIKRLRRIEGQIRGIYWMVEQGRSCEDILIQVGSAKASLHKTGQLILQSHLHHCVENGIRKGKEGATIKKLCSSIELLSRLV